MFFSTLQWVWEPRVLTIFVCTLFSIKYGTFSQNGKADKREVLTYLDPKHPFRSQEDAGRLIDLADSNGDGFIDLDEVLAYAEEFLESKWANPELVFHGDLALF